METRSDLPLSITSTVSALMIALSNITQERSWRGIEPGDGAAARWVSGDGSVSQGCRALNERPETGVSNCKFSTRLRSCYSPAKQSDGNGFVSQGCRAMLLLASMPLISFLSIVIGLCSAGNSGTGVDPSNFGSSGSRVGDLRG